MGKVRKASNPSQNKALEFAGGRGGISRRSLLKRTAGALVGAAAASLTGAIGVRAQVSGLYVYNAPPELPLPSDSQPVAPPAASPTDGLPTSQTDQTPANLPGASLSPASLEGALNGGQEARDTMLAGLVLTLALERIRVSATHKQAGKPAGARNYN